MKLKRLANILIAAGIILAAVGVIYEAANYPWRILLGKLGFSVSDTLPDPKPLKNEYGFSDLMNVGAQKPEGLPAGNSGLLMRRPHMKLSLIGSIKIPALGISENVLEGADEELLYGVGHILGTAFPGGEGNCALAGHRNYVYMHPFMHLPKLKIGDRVQVSAQDKTYTYEIYEMFTVKPEDTSVIEPQEGETSMLTLITCTPIPSYSERLICWGRLVTDA